MGAIGIGRMCTGQVCTSDDSERTAVRLFLIPFRMESMASAIPVSIQGQKYISLTTFRKSGVGVATPVWFGEEAGKLYVMTRSDMGKTKRIRNNPQVRVAPCTIRGIVTGAEIAATARILPPEQHARARQAINRKYWAARIPLLWWRTDTYIEISFD
jgi:PPOX class probable F420-dependent enzyme